MELFSTWSETHFVPRGHPPPWTTCILFHGGKTKKLTCRLKSEENCTLKFLQYEHDLLRVWWLRLKTWGQQTLQNIKLQKINVNTARPWFFLYVLGKPSWLLEPWNQQHTNHKLVESNAGDEEQFCQGQGHVRTGLVLGWNTMIFFFFWHTMMMNGHSCYFTVWEPYCHTSNACDLSRAKVLCAQEYHSCSWNAGSGQAVTAQLPRMVLKAGDWKWCAVKTKNQSSLHLFLRSVIQFIDFE